MAKLPTGKQWDTEDLKTRLENKTISYRNLSWDGVRKVWAAWYLSCGRAALKFIDWTPKLEISSAIYLEVVFFSKMSFAIKVRSQTTLRHFVASSLNHGQHFLFGFYYSTIFDIHFLLCWLTFSSQNSSQQHQGGLVNLWSLFRNECIIPG